MIALVLGLAVLGFLLYLLFAYVPMPDVMRTVIIFVVVICILMYLVNAFGVADIPLPRMRR